MGESFGKQGYDTAAIGKWHLGHTVPAHHPNSRGFDYFMGSLNTGGDYFTHRNQGGYDLQRNGESTPELAGKYNTDVYSNEAVHWILQRARQAEAVPAVRRLQGAPLAVPGPARADRRARAG